MINDLIGPSSGSDIQNIPNTRHQSKKINSEGYDGDCEIENEKNRPTKKGTRSCMGKQKSTNSLNKDSTSSTSAPATEEMDVDLLGFERLVTPLPLSPLPCHLVSTPAQLTPELLNVRGSQIKCKSPVVMAAPKLLFETPIEKPEKKTKRKRIARHRQAQVRMLFNSMHLLERKMCCKLYCKLLDISSY